MREGAEVVNLWPYRASEDTAVLNRRLSYYILDMESGRKDGRF